MGFNTFPLQSAVQILSLVRTDCVNPCSGNVTALTTAETIRTRKAVVRSCWNQWTTSFCSILSHPFCLCFIFLCFVFFKIYANQVKWRARTINVCLRKNAATEETTVVMVQTSLTVEEVDFFSLLKVFILTYNKVETKTLLFQPQRF